MVDSATGEAFIPCRRKELIELCLEEGKFEAAEAQQFRDFCQILSAYYHFRFHQKLETLKDCFVPFNPNLDIKPRANLSDTQQRTMEAALTETFQTLLESANYFPLDEATLQQTFEQKALIDLKTKVDFEDFDRMLLYCRGDVCKEIWVKRWFKRVQKTIQVFERVILLVKFKPEDYFIAKKIKPEEINFVPGKMYLYFYKNIPKFDLEFLFPNVETSMTWKDRLLFGIPAIGASIAIVFRVLRHLLLIVGAILLVTGVPASVEYLKTHQKEVQDVFPILVAVLSLSIAMGGFAFKQYTNYQSKKIKFQKEVTDKLFYRNLANNAGVFQALVDAAEEEECKEIILVYYHLLTCNTSLTPAQLDQRIEAWLHEKLGVAAEEVPINFDIQKTLDNLAAIKGKVVERDEDMAAEPAVPLIGYAPDGSCQALSLDKAKRAIDYIWDRAFLYAN